MIPVVRASSRCLFAWLARAAACWGGGVWAQQQAPLDLAQLPQRIGLVSRLQLLVDQEAALQPVEAMRQPGVGINDDQTA